LTFIFFIGCRLSDNYLLEEINKCNILYHKFKQILTTNDDKDPSKTNKRSTLRDQCQDLHNQVKDKWKEIEDKKKEKRHNDGLNISEEMYNHLMNEYAPLEEEIENRLRLHKKCKVLIWRMVEIVFLIVVADLLIFYPVFPAYLSKFVLGLIFIIFGFITFRTTKKLICTSLKLLEDCLKSDNDKLCTDIDELCENLKFVYKKCLKGDNDKICKDVDNVYTVLNKLDMKNIVMFFAELLVFFLVVFIIDNLYFNAGLISPHPTVSFLINPVYIILVILAGNFGILLIDIFWRNVFVDKSVKKMEVKNIPNGMLLNYVDWIIDRYSCKKNEKVVITITNLGNQDIVIKENDKVCEVYEEGHEDEVGYYSIMLPEEGINITIPSFGNYSFYWDTKNVKAEGVYRIKPIAWPYPLRRSVFVHMQLRDEDLNKIEGLFNKFKEEFDKDKRLKENLKANCDKIQQYLDEAKESKDKKSILELHNAVSFCLKNIYDTEVLPFSLKFLFFLK